MRPLDRLRSIKVKLGVVIVAAISAAYAVNEFGLALELSFKLRILIALALSLAVVQFLAHGMTSPLRDMAAATRAMATGDYTRRVRASSRDEVGELAHAFNRMAAELAVVDRQRRDLVANASHELRTPITALQALLENLVDGVEQADPRSLQVALEQTERLGRLVTELLDLSQLESGRAQIIAETVPLRDFVAQAVSEASLAARDVRLSSSVEPADLSIEADPARLHQVLANLLDNASRHSPPGGTVTVSARARDGGVRLAVADEGPGIPFADRDRVFERFSRLDDARASRDGGGGLGLAIAREVVELHGGVLRAEENAPSGCRMVVDLPAGRPPTGPVGTGPLPA
ncbi:MAG: ATP-binding protein [Mycobacteriales bacterium]